MKRLAFGAIFLLFASALDASAFQDWSSFRPEDPTQGVWLDARGSTLTPTQVEGPAVGEKAVRIESDLVQWGGFWIETGVSLTAGEGLRFKARSDGGAQLSVMLTDSNKVQVEHVVRLNGGDWESFELPLASFKKTEYQDPGAPANGVFDFGKVAALSLSPRGPGYSVITVGPLTVANAPTALSDGQGNPDMVQDFVFVDQTAHGPFTDDQGSKISLEVKPGAPETKAVAAYFDYTEVPKGWCGEWIRTGGDWKGQDWTGAKGLEVEICSQDSLSLLMAFNDTNQNAYQSSPVSVSASAGTWQTVVFQLSSFSLDSHYQPPHAKLGASQDLSSIVAFNLSPLTEGTHQFWVRSVKLER